MPIITHFFSSKENLLHSKCPPIGKLNCLFGKGRWTTAEAMTNAVTDAEELGEFGHICSEESHYSFLFIALIILFCFIYFLAEQYSHNNGAPPLVLCTVKRQ